MAARERTAITVRKQRFQEAADLLKQKLDHVLSEIDEVLGTPRKWSSDEEG